MSKRLWESFKAWLKETVRIVGGAQVPDEYRPEFRADELPVVGEKEYLVAIRVLTVMYGFDMMEGFMGDTETSREAFRMTKTCLELGSKSSSCYGANEHGRTWLELSEVKREHIGACLLCQKLFGYFGACPDA